MSPYAIPNIITRKRHLKNEINISDLLVINGKIATTVDISPAKIGIPTAFNAYLIRVIRSSFLDNLAVRLIGALIYEWQKCAQLSTEKPTQMVTLISDVALIVNPHLLQSIPNNRATVHQLKALTEAQICQTRLGIPLRPIISAQPQSLQNRRPMDSRSVLM